ncbi:MAG: mycothiol transferase [Actinomycetes bacterium]
MSDLPASRALLVDAFGRAQEQMQELTATLPDDLAGYRPDREANSIAWLLWHLTRIQDDHVAGLAGIEQVWPAWRERFGLPFPVDDTGYGHTADQVSQVRADGELLGGYYAEVHAATLRYLDGLTAEELERVVDTRWDPPVTAAVRLVSVIGDVMQHLGQAAYVRGLAERRARAWREPSAADH